MMIDVKEEQLADILALNAELDAAHEKAARSARLEHARMGRSVCESHDGQIVWLTPEEIFASYGLDANGKPK
ncbi:MAG TPA: hypothetical protein VN641_03890 [Urbifossiella sp.]|jgi:hypothetical protein|nr:hypothetical protein [Urbifossiella sp.]